MKSVKKISSFLFILFIVLFGFVQTTSAASFRDVKPDFWAYSSIEWAAGKGYVNGYEDGQFKPRNTLTEAEFITMLTRYDCGYKNLGTANKHWADANYAYLKTKNMPLRGNDSLVERNKAITRGEVARIIAAFDGLDLSLPYAVQYMYLENLSNGLTGKKNFEDYGPNRSLNRAEAVAFLERVAKRGNCQLQGLYSRAIGLDDSRYAPLPVDFLGDTTVWYGLPNGFSQPGLTPSNDVRVSAVDIEKGTLNANGIDETFVTLMLKDCDGVPISYEEEALSFQTTSKVGAVVKSSSEDFTKKSSDFRNVIAEKYWHDDHYDYWVRGTVQLSNAAYVLAEFDNGTDAITIEVIDSQFYSDYYAFANGDNFQTVKLTAFNQSDQPIGTSFVVTITEVATNPFVSAASTSDIHASSVSSQTIADGPELTIAVTAPATTKAVTDTISFKMDPASGTKANLSCYTRPIELNLNYVPQVELRVTSVKSKIEANGTEGTEVTAQIVLPGGGKLTDFNGKVRFSSSQNATLSAREVTFVNGLARTTVTSKNTTEVMVDRISAELIQVDERYRKDVASLLGRSHSTELVYDPGIAPACSIEDLEIAFVIDSSGSMLKNDVERLRVSKSQELLGIINAPQNIGADFDSQGRLLKGRAPVDLVQNALRNVREHGGTNIGSGLEKALNAFSNEAVPKVAILLTDGKSSKAKTRQVVQQYKQKGIKIFTVALGDKRNIDEAFLQEISLETGGKYYHAASNIDIGTAYQSILTEISCGAPACPQSNQAFVSPSIELSSSNIFMNTLMNESCGPIARVVVRFKAPDGDVDYELIHRNHGYYELKKGRFEIARLDMMSKGIFLAYNQQGQVVGQVEVPIVLR